jgi:CRP/FNR family transcriptional regulator
MSDHDPPDWLVRAPVFAKLDRDALALAASAVRRVALPAGAHVFEPGQPCSAFLIMTAGRVRVQLTAESGREIVLYRIERGETCVLTTSCILGSEPYGAEAVCETAVEAIALPTATFRALLDSSAAFRDAILSAYAARVGDLVLTIEETLFQRVDARLAAFLRERARDGVVTMTHQALAVELGSAREVVSRILKRFERAGAIALARGAIEIRNARKLTDFAAES